MDIVDGRVDGYPNLGISVISLENPALRGGYGLDPYEDRGVLVTRIAHRRSNRLPLHPGDIILSIDGFPVRANGKVLVGENLLDLSYLVSGKQVGEQLRVQMLRDGAELSLSLMCELTPDLVEYKCYDKDFQYYLFGGMLFCPLYGDKLLASGDNWPDAEMYYYTTQLQSAERQQVVYLHTVFQHELTRNMPGLDHIVRSVNGSPIHSFDVLVKVLDAATGIVEIEFDSAIKLRLDADDMRSIEPEVMKTYSIPSKAVLPSWTLN
jgi:hypothetical protein